MNHPQIRLLGLSTCPQCRALRELLDSHHIGYEATNVDLLPPDERAEVLREMAPHNPRKAFPVLFIGGKAIIGLQRDLILAELGVAP